MSKLKIVNNFDPFLTNVLASFVGSHRVYALADIKSVGREEELLIIDSYHHYLDNVKYFNNAQYIVILPKYDYKAVQRLIADDVLHYLISDEHLADLLVSVLHKHYKENFLESSVLEEMLRRQENDNSFLVIVDPFLNVVKFNKYYRKMFHTDEDEPKQLITNDLNSSYVTDAIVMSVSNGRPWFGELKKRDKTGKIITYTASVVPYYKNGRINYMLIHGRVVKNSLKQSAVSADVCHGNRITIPAVEISFTHSGRVASFDYFTDNFIGYTKEDFKRGINFYDLFTDTKESITNQIKDTLTKKSTMMLHLELINNRSERFPVLCCLFRDTKNYRSMINAVLLNLYYYRDYENKFNIIINNISEYIYSMKYDEGVPVYTYHSPRCHDITGYTSLEFYNDPDLWSKMIYGEDRESMRTFFDRIVNGHENSAGEIELRIVKKDGTVRWILNKCTMNTLCDGTATLDGIILDITERKKMEETLRNEERKLRMLLENGSDVITLISLNTEIQYMSNSSQKNLGYSSEELVGSPYIDMVHPEDKYNIYQAISNIMTDHSSTFSVKYKIMHKNGSYRLFETKGSYILDDDGIEEIILNSRDVTDLDQLLMQLQELALYDELTGLYNRRGFKTLALQQIKISNRTTKKLYLYFIDMDNMKVINDRYGHDMGDKALLLTKNILTSTFRESDIVSRLGGDEFVALVLETAEHTEDQLLSRLNDIINKMNAESGLPYKVALSVGIAAYDPRMPCTYEELLRRADNAMYDDKNRKKY